MCQKAVGCITRRNAVSQQQGIRVFRIPADRSRRSAWIKAMSRKNWTPYSRDVVCSKHFVSGEPSTFREDVDYRPTLLTKGMDQEHVSVSDTSRNKASLQASI
jgi:hypothetical protein